MYNARYKKYEETGDVNPSVFMNNFRVSFRRNKDEAVLFYHFSGNYFYVQKPGVLTAGVRGCDVVTSEDLRALADFIDKVEEEETYHKQVRNLLTRVREHLMYI